MKRRRYGGTDAFLAPTNLGCLRLNGGEKTRVGLCHKAGNEDMYLQGQLKKYPAESAGSSLNESVSTAQ
jgi:hypothetical protein